jgi:hypothetical protein
MPVNYDYSRWQSNAVVTLGNVQWDPQYRNVVNLSDDALLAYLRSNVHHSTVRIKRTVDIRPGEPVQLSITVPEAQKYNYLVVEHRGVNVPGDERFVYKYFITHVEYATASSSNIYLQLDVWQTYISKVKVGRFFLERGHAGIADGNQRYAQGQYRLTAPEGFNLGDEYTVLRTWEMSPTSASNGKGYHDYLFCIVSSTEIFGNAGDASNPNLKIPQASNMSGVPIGVGCYVMDVNVLMYVFRKIETTPWIAQGIQSITVLPINKNFINTNAWETHNENGFIYWKPNPTPVDTADDGTLSMDIVLIPDFRWETIKYDKRYAHLWKFATYPYSIIEITTYSGAPLILKPEKIEGEHLVVRYTLQPIQPNARAIISPLNYNKDVHKSDVGFRSEGEFLDVQTGIYDLPQLPVASSSYLNYLASNAHQIAFSYDNADWSQQKALRAAELTFETSANNASLGLTNNGLATANMAGQATIANKAAIGHVDNSLIGAGGNVVSSTIGGLASGGVGGAFMGFASSAFGQTVNQMQRRADLATDISARNASTALNMGTSSQMAMNSYKTSMQNADLNYNYAKFAAKGDYANAIAATNAKVQDAKMLQPSVNGQFGGNLLNAMVYGFRVHAKIKTCTPQMREYIGEYWLRYGYTVNRWVGKMPKDFLCMTKMTYWKCQDVQLYDCPIPSLFRDTIRGIFESGVTVWRHATDIGLLDPADNKPIEGYVI